MFRREEEEDYISLCSDVRRRKTIYHYVQTCGGGRLYITMFRREEEEDYISLCSDMWRRKTIYHYVQT